MPRRDTLHTNAREALESDGWTITHDPMIITLPDMDLFIDLGVKRFIGAQKGSKKIAVEIKSFLNNAGISSFYEALGQILIYRIALEKVKIKRDVYLAIPENTRYNLFESFIVKEVLKRFNLNLITFNPVSKKIIQWERF